MNASEYIRECACGPAPECGVWTAEEWVGDRHYMRVLTRRIRGEYFCNAEEMHQRTFLLLVAEDIESRSA